MKLTLKNFIEALENRYFDQLEDEFTVKGLTIAVMDTLKVFLETNSGDKPLDITH